MRRQTIGRNDRCFCGSGKKYKKCCYPRALPDFSKPNAGLADPLEEHEAFDRACMQLDVDPPENENVTFANVDVGRTRLVCAPLAPYGEGHSLALAGTLAPPTPLQVEAKYTAIRERNADSVTEVILTYRYPEMFGFAEARMVFDADEHFQWVNGRAVSVLDLFQEMNVLMADGTIGEICSHPERRYDLPIPPLPDDDGLWTSRVTGRVKHTAHEIIEFYWANQMVRVTPGHVVWSADRRGWVGAHELLQGELIRVAGNVVAPVEGARRVPGLIEVFGIEVEYFHNYFVGSGPNAMLVHNGPQCLNRPAVAEALEEGAINPTSRRAAGVLTDGELNPQHHIFPQEERTWFARRGIDVDQYTVTLDNITHDALHAGGGPGRGGGWWNGTMMNRLNQLEAVGGQLTPSQIQAVGSDMLQRMNLGNLPIVPYGR